MLNSNEPIKVAHPQKIANQPMLNGALVTEMVSNLFSENNKNFSRLRKHEMYEILIAKNISPSNFAKYVSCSEMQKNRMLLVF